MSNNFGARPIQSALAVQVVAMAMVASPLFYLLLIFLLRAVMSPEELAETHVAIDYAKELMAAFFLLSIFAFLAAPKVRSLLAGGDNASLQVRMRAVIVSMVIAETGGILGLLLFFLAGRFSEACVLIVLSFVTTILLFPSRAWLEAENKPR